MRKTGHSYHLAQASARVSKQKAKTRFRVLKWVQTAFKPQKQPELNEPTKVGAGVLTPSNSYFRNLVGTAAAKKVARVGLAIPVPPPSAPDAKPSPPKSLLRKTAKSLRQLKGLGKLRQAVKVVKLANRMAINEAQTSDELQMWLKMREQDAPEARLLPHGQSTCSCVQAFPMATYIPTHLCARGKLHWELFSTRNRATSTMITCLMVLYMPVATRVLSMFLCEEIGASWRMSVWRSAECFSRTWNAHVPVALFGLVCFVVGLPLLLLRLVAQRRRAQVAEYMHLLRPFDASTEASMESPTDASAEQPRRCACHVRNRRSKSGGIKQLLLWRWRQACQTVGVDGEPAAVNGPRHDDIKVRYTYKVRVSCHADLEIGSGRVRSTQYHGAKVGRENGKGG